MAKSTATPAADTSKRVHAFTDDAMATHDAVALAELIRKGELDATEVAKAAIARARSVADKLNAIEIAAYDQALAQTHLPAKPGVFAGVPTFVKDNADLEGFPTRNGTRSFTPAAAEENGPYTAQYLSQGFTVLGKSQMPEFGFNASTEFEGDHPTRNPWNTDYSPGGSSGGSAALVAAGVVPIAHANDGGGSIRVPAACCGLVGLKPTRNRHLNNKSAQSMPINIVSEGVVTRSVRDTAQFMYGMESVYKNPRLKPVGKVEGPSQKKLRIGLVIDSITGTPTCPETRAAVEDIARLMEKLGHRVEPITLNLPATFIDDFTLYWAMLAFMMGSLGKFLLGSDFDYDRLDPFSKGLVQHYRKNLLHTPAALWRLHRSANLYAEIMKPYDAVLSPVLGHTVPKLGHLNPGQGYDDLMEKLSRYIMFTPLNNATGSPAISLPLAHSAEGLPIGIQFQAAHGNERTLLEIAYLLEAERPFNKIQA
ncbi:MAG TPA: amidase [Turneriella sp.]|nr:amidase [Turneriella sp.]HNM99699.1 amidase [Turneriella sp.]